MTEKSIMDKIIDAFVEDFSKDAFIGKSIGESMRKVISEDELKKSDITKLLIEGESDEDTQA